MAYIYDDYITLEGEAKLTRLRLHIREVSRQIGPDVASHGSSKSTGGLAEYLKGLKEEEKQMSATAGSIGGGAFHARFVEPG